MPRQQLDEAAQRRIAWMKENPDGDATGGPLGEDRVPYDPDDKSDRYIVRVRSQRAWYPAEE